MPHKIFVSFDWENDRYYKHLLTAWNGNDRFPFEFIDGSSDEINSNDIGRVKAALTRKINQCTHTLVIVGAEANKLHKDQIEIGYRNWINFEVAQSKVANNQLVAVKLSKDYASPDELLNASARWATFTHESIFNALYGQ